MQEKILGFLKKQLRIHRLLFWLSFAAFVFFAITFEVGYITGDSIMKTVCFVVPCLLCFIFLDLYIVPNFYTKERLVWLAASTIGLLIFAILLELLLEFLFLDQQEFDIRLKLTDNLRIISPWIIVVLLILLTEAQYKKAIEKANAELQYLKQQINPHFLLNTHNNIFFLIEQNPELASSALLKLSDILKYALYESGENFVSLQKEIENLNNYIELERIRKNENVILEFDFPDNINDIKIAPLLLITFVENAFKHVSNYKDKPNYISARLKVDNNEILFCVSNTYNDKNLNQKAGIGLINVKKRLRLLYPKNHTLKISEENGIFNVNLLIQY
jgi:sensor histidine kinase YesM